MDTVILMPGPTHLFFTTGVYYAYLLSKKFKVVLLLDKRGFNPKSEAILQKIKNIENNILIEFIEPGGNRFSYLLKLCNNSRFIIDKHRPKFIFLNTTVYPQDIFFFIEARRRNIPIVRFLGSLMTNDDEKEREFIKPFNEHNKRIIFSPYIFNLLKSVIIYKIIPLFMAHKFYYPELDIYLNRDNVARRIKFETADFTLIYSKREKEILINKGLETDKVFVVQHPVETIGGEVNNLIYRNIQETDSILILPTYGIVDFLVKKGIADVATFADKWKQAIGMLMEKFPYKILLKLHPAEGKDRLWAEALETLKANYNNLEIIPPEELAEALILKSKIIVSDFSSVLWWAKFISNKIVISLNLFDVPLGGHFKTEEGVYYFEDVEEFKKAQLMPYSYSGRGQLPDLMSFLDAKFKN